MFFYLKNFEVLPAEQARQAPAISGTHVWAEVLHVGKLSLQDCN